MYVVTIEGFLPERLNVLLRLHWAKRQRALKSDAERVWAAVREASVPPATGCRRMSVRFESPRTPADRDARLKSLQDALVKAKMLFDDSPHWLLLGNVESVRGPTRRTVITLEDVYD
jgi:Holliday junction resolvase RusA-like endonuclease